MHMYYIYEFNIYSYIERKFMRTTLNIDDKLIEEASKFTGIKEKTKLIRLGLETLIYVESSKKLAKLGKTEKQLKQVPRRRYDSR